MNLNTDANQTIEIYKIFLNSINKIVESKHDKGSQPIKLNPMNTGVLSDKENNTTNSGEEDNDND